MSVNTISTAFVEQYRSNVIHLAQQGRSRLWSEVQLKDSITGKAAYFERIGKSRMQPLVTRHDDTPILNTPHSRRKVTMAAKNWGDMIDKNDDIRVLIDPTSAYTQSAAGAVGREKDGIIIDALVGSSWGGVDGTTEIPLPVGQQIAANSQGLTLQKLLDAKELMDANEIGGGDGENGSGSRIFIFSARQLAELLTDTKLTSADYTTVQALVRGQINEFLGFRFVRIEPRKAAPTAGTASGDNYHGLPYNQSTDVTTCIAFYGPSVGLAIGMMDKFYIAERPDKNFNKQLYVEMDMGATRIEEEAVCLIECDNSPSP